MQSETCVTQNLSANRGIDRAGLG
ncbi:uncharacterized protein METZ01_LOCUS101845 [marine metagenome]|uniref:Uncharacterized protein n=1 Tax=marine metagenome TaxID=408172 RepID=A0A381W9L6_9ZZZZ